MEKEPKLKTKLDFKFNIDDLEIPVLDFLSEDPAEKTDEIRIIKKRRKTRKKSTTKLF